MCGIAGIISYREKIDKEVCEKIIENLKHRGPDDSGIYISRDKNVALCNTRLSIIDLSQRAHQPMSNEDETLWITYNGEIYNYRELKNELIEKGHKFKSNSDTEVILHLYEEEKEECFQKLRGIFAFALWDEKERKLFLIRDKMGVKPLYYYIDENFFIFSSELKAIINLNFIKKNINFKALEGFLYFGSIPFPYTLFNEIKSLEPASYLILNDKEIRIKRYWKIKLNYNKYSDYESIKENLYNFFEESIKINLIADVPVGIFLSGGIDSGTVLYFARKNNQNNLKTFSIVFKEKEFDERNHSRLLASKFETEHYEYEVAGEEMKEEIENFIKFMDMPTIDGFNIYFVSKFAKENGIKVSLSGLGGDELFGGYSSFFLVPEMLKFKNFKFFFKIISNFLKEDKKDKLNYFLSNPLFEGAFFTVRGIYFPDKLKKILKYKNLNFNPLNYLEEIIKKENFENENLINKISILELRTYMHNQLLRDTDNFSMCNSLEVRVPLIDPYLLEFSFSMDSHYRIGKKILKDLMKNYLPCEIIKKAKKGFFFPIERWLKKDLRDFLMEGLEMDTFFDKREVMKLYKKFESRNIHWSRIWAISILNHYLKLNKLC